MFKEGDKVTIWDGYRDTEDTIVKGVNGRLFLDIHDEEVNEKNIEDFNIRYSENEFNRLMEIQREKDKKMMDFFNGKF